MSEHQNIEYKLHWKDDYIKWVCGFTNSSGGKIYIGINDNGEIIGIENYKALLEQLPNKFRDVLGINPQIKLLQKNDKYYIEIEVNQYSVPISYKGNYFLRSGSTNQELKGVSLNDFLFKKVGRSWEAELVDNATIDDLDTDTINKFKTLASNRLLFIKSESNTSTLLEKLNLISEGKLKRASILLFGKNVQTFYLQAQVKIGLFSSETDIVSNDRIEGNLLQQVERVMEILGTKYLLNTITYEGIYRKDSLEIPSEALREAVINAIIHRTYLTNSSIQIKITPKTLEIMNENSPFNLIKVEDLKTNHLSKPVNPLLADIFYKAGLIESWGRGTLKIVEECKKQNLKEPDFILNNNYFSVIFHRKDKDVTINVVDNVVDNRFKKILNLLNTNNKLSAQELSEYLGVSKRTIQRDLNKLKENGKLERIGSEKGGYWKIKE